MSDRITSYQEFWQYYLREHSRPVCRALHYIGSSLGIAFLIALIATGFWWLLLAGMVSGYGFAWIGHFFFEGNRPATFRYPLWSFISDWKMYGLALTGRLKPELERAGVGAASAA